MTTPTPSVDAAYAKFEALGETEQRLAVDAMRREAVRRCAADGLFFLQFVKTRDEADPEQSVKPFPLYLDYLRETWREVSTNQVTAIVKSRQLLLSWVMCCFAVHWARFKPNQYVVWQTQNDDDANKMVSMAGGDKDATYLGRMQFIEKNLPKWLQVPIRDVEGSIGYPNGSMIEALPGGANKVRSKVPSLYIGDEFAMQDEAKGVWTSLAPLVQKGSKVVLISTPNGADGNMFYHLWHGTPYRNPTSG